MKHDVTITAENTPALVRMDDMPDWSVGIIEKSPIPTYVGRIVMRSRGSNARVCALDDGGYWPVPTPGNENMVRLLPKGTKITLTVGD